MTVTEFLKLRPAICVGALALVISWLSGCATADPRSLFPEKAETDAAADFARGRIVHYNVGGIAAHAPGVPPEFAPLLAHAGRGDAGAGAGCSVDEKSPTRHEYAVRYNRAMVRQLLAAAGRTTEEFDAAVERAGPKPRNSKS